MIFEIDLISIKKSILILSFIVFLIYLYIEPLYIPTAISTGIDHYIFPNIIAHKAKVSESFPGNSLSAIEEALASTVDGIEVDVRISKDGMLFLYHGDTLEEYTNDFGIPENYDWNQLSDIQYKNTKEKLVSLDEFLSRVGTQKVIFLDVKSPNIINKKITHKIVDLIKKYHLQENIFVESFNPFILLFIRLYARDIMVMYDFADKTNALGEESQEQFNKIPWLLKQHWIHKQIRRIIRPDILGPRFNMNEDVMKNLIQHGYPIVSWTVDDPAIAHSLYEIGVKGIQTNQPEAIAMILPQKNKKIYDAGGTKVVINQTIHISQIDDILQAIKKARETGKSLTIGGQRHSMGGQALLNDGIFINMLPFNKVEYNADSLTVTVQAGATWKKIQEVLAEHGRSIKVMQSDNIFTVGGSISVNVHGWQVASAPIASTIVNMAVITPDGKIRKISSNTDSELFSLVIGGYGMFAVIVNAELITVPNSSVKFHSYFTKSKFLVKSFQEKITNNSNAELAYARLSMDQEKLFDEAGLFWYETQKGKKQDKITEESITEGNSIKPENLVALKRGIFRLSEYSNITKKFRWSAEKSYSFIVNTKQNAISRNDAMNTDIHILWPLYGDNKDILHEYFIPKEKLYEFIKKLEYNIIKYNINALNVTIREVLKDNISFLAYAREDVFGLVCLFSQMDNMKDEEQMKNFTQSVIAEAINLGGTFYLPYRLHYTLNQVLESYPNISEWIDKKKKYDPNLLLNSQFFIYLSNMLEK